MSLPTDTQMLDWLAEKDCGVISDDAGRFAVPSAGFQSCPDPRHPSAISSSFYVEAGDWKPTIREAIADAMRENP